MGCIGVKNLLTMKMMIFWSILGLTATLARNGTWNMVYFGLYHTAKDYIPPAKVII